MMQKKICILGAFAVGKTSLVERFVKGIFSAKYLTTVGVKVDKKLVEVAGQELTLVLWDLHGEDEFQKLRVSYLRGAAGYFLVVDGTRSETLDTALALQRTAQQALGAVPFVLILNKTDLHDEWEVESRDLEALTRQNWSSIETSAKTGEGVEEAFALLAGKLLED